MVIDDPSLAGGQLCPGFNMGEIWQVPRFLLNILAKCLYMYLEIGSIETILSSNKYMVIRTANIFMKCELFLSLICLIL